MRVAPGLGCAADRQGRQVTVVGGQLVAWLVLAVQESWVARSDVGVEPGRCRTGTSPAASPEASPVPMARAAGGGRAATPASVESTVTARADRGRVRATTATLAARTRAWCSLRLAMSSGVSWNICHHPMPATTAKAGHSTEYR